MKKGTVVTGFVEFKKTGGLLQLKADINKALEQVAFKYGIKIDAGKCSYQNSFADFKVTASIISVDGNAETKETTEFRQMAKHVGLSPDDLFREFMHNGKIQKIIGMRYGRKNPVLTQRSDGKQFFFPISLVQTGLAMLKKKAA